MILSEKLFEKLFSSKNTKDAYMKACKWIAMNILNKVETGDITYKVTRVESSLPTFKLELFINLEEKEFRDNRCKRCKEFHKLFYINQDYNCSACRMMGYVDEAKERLKAKKTYKNSKLNL